MSFGYGKYTAPTQFRTLGSWHAMVPLPPTAEFHDCLMVEKRLILYSNPEQRLTINGP